MDKMTKKKRTLQLPVRRIGAYLAQLAECLPRYKEQITDKTARAYAVALTGIPVQWVERATLRMTRDPSIRDFPRASEIRAYAIRLHHRSLPDPVEAWRIRTTVWESTTLNERAVIQLALDSMDDVADGPSQGFHVFIRIYGSIWSQIVRDFDIDNPDTHPTTTEKEESETDFVDCVVIEAYDDELISLEPGQEVSLPIGMAIMLRAKGVVREGGMA